MTFRGYAKEYAHKYVYKLTSSSTIDSMNIERKVSIVQKLLSKGPESLVRSIKTVTDTTCSFVMCLRNPNLINQIRSFQKVLAAAGGFAR
jgi:hypothetical protein